LEGRRRATIERSPPFLFFGPITVRVLDPIVAAATVGLVVSPAAGSLVLRGFEGAPIHWRRTAAWLAVAGACCATGVAMQLGSGRLAEWLFIVLLGAVPGVLAFVVFRTMTASALVSLVPMYFGIGAMTLGRPLHTPGTAGELRHRATRAPRVPAFSTMVGSHGRHGPRDHKEERCRRSRAAPLS
jgi:hypothetical protein